MPGRRPGRGYTEIVRALLEAGADINAVGASGIKAKNLAYSRGYVETAKLIERYEQPMPPVETQRKAQEKTEGGFFAALKRWIRNLSKD